MIYAVNSRGGWRVIFSEDDLLDGEVSSAVQPQVFPYQIITERDVILAKLDIITIRHRDQMDSGSATTLTDSQYLDVLAYKQALRDLPGQPGFPDEVVWPVTPSWYA